MSIRSIIAAIFMAATVSLPAAASAQAPVDRPAEVRTGTCDALGDVVATLANLVLTEGQTQGQAGGTPVEQSGTVVPFTLDTLLSASHAVVVRQSPGDPTSVACGVIGGALNPDGTLAVGMDGVNGSGLSGVAYFTPIIEFNNMLITILLVGGDTAAAPLSVKEASYVEATNEAADTPAVVDDAASINVSIEEGSGGSEIPATDEEESANP